MAPTEILAEQHLRKLVGWLTPLGVDVAWLTGSRKGMHFSTLADTGHYQPFGAMFPNGKDPLSEKYR